MPSPNPAPPPSDAAASVPSLRTLGTGPQQAAAGDDARFTALAGGINQLTGDVTAGPGTGSQAATVVNLPAGVTAAGRLVVTAIAAPSAPTAGLAAFYVDSTSKNLAVKDDTGVVKHGVQTKAVVATQFLTGVADDGSVSAAQPNFTDLAGSIAAGQVPSSLVTNAKLANMAAATLKGNNTGSPAAPIDLTATQVTGMLDVFASGAKGLAPASGGGTTNYLRADGTWATPPGTASGITQLTGDVTAGPGSGSQAAVVANLPAGVTAAGRLVATAVAAPTTPSAGLAAVYVDSTSKNLSVKDDTGVVKHGVRTKTATANQFLTAIADDGTVSAAQPSASDVTGLATIATSGSGADLTDATVALAKLANISANTYLGSIAGGVPAELPITAAGRAMNSAADPAAQRLLLSLTDIGDLRAYAISRAKTVLALTGNPMVVIDESFIKAPGTSPSWFAAAGGAGTSAQRTDRSGGWTTLASTAAAGTDRNINIGGATVVHNVGGVKWYQLWLFSLDTAVESGTFLEMGWIDTGLSATQPKIGALGSSSTTKFRAFDNTSGVSSAVDLDTGIHIGEHWCDGAGNIYMSIDGESPVTYATAKTAACQPIVQVSNGSTAAIRSLSVGHFICITP